MIKIGDLMEHRLDMCKGKPVMAILLDDACTESKGFSLLVLLLNSPSTKILHHWRSLSYWRVIK